MKPDNIFAALPADLAEEVVERLAGSEHVKIERIISNRHASPASGWYDQARVEWVMVLRGEAIIAFAHEDEDTRDDVHLRPGDHLTIPAHCKHKVKWTTPKRETVWLAVHF